MLCTLRVVNQALESNTSTFSTFVDSVPPACTGVGLWEFAPGDVAFVGYRESVVASFECTDGSGSGIVASEWAVGTAPGLDDALPWTAAAWTVPANGTAPFELPWRGAPSPQTRHEWAHNATCLSGVRYCGVLLPPLSRLLSPALTPSHPFSRLRSPSLAVSHPFPPLLSPPLALARPRSPSPRCATS